MNYRLEIHDRKPADHLVGVRCFCADTGLSATEQARLLLAGTPGSYGDLSFDDTTGTYVPYTTVEVTR